MLENDEITIKVRVKSLVIHGVTLGHATIFEFFFQMLTIFSN